MPRVVIFGGLVVMMVVLLLIGLVVMVVGGLLLMVRGFHVLLPFVIKILIFLIRLCVQFVNVLCL